MRATGQEHAPPTLCLPEYIRHSGHSVLGGWRWQRTDDLHRTGSPTMDQSWRPSSAVRGFAEHGLTFWRAQQHPQSSELGPELWQPFLSPVGRTIRLDQHFVSLLWATLKGKTYMGLIPLPERSSVNLDDGTFDEGVRPDKLIV